MFIETTRPELIPAVVALIAHPDDERYQPLFGTTVTSPLFGVEMPGAGPPGCRDGQGRRHRDVLHVRRPHRRALVARAAAADPRGRRPRRPASCATPPSGSAGGPGAALYASSPARRRSRPARRWWRRCASRGDLDGEPTATQRMANFYEKGDKPLEIVTSRQWYIRNGGRDADLRADVARARRASSPGCPTFMRHRYENWVERPQRRLADQPAALLRRAVPGLVPRWTTTASPLHDDPILADEAALPVDPSSDPPPGFTEDQRDVPGGFTGDPDVMDTWATSSLSPHIVVRLGARRRPVRAHLPDGPATRTRTRSSAPGCSPAWCARTSRTARLPWERSMISGFVVDPDRKKMSKSKGNAIVPTEILDRFGADAVRWRAAMARPGHGLAVRREPDEGRPPAGDQGAQRQQVRARHQRRDRATSRRSPSRWTPRCSPGWPRSCARPPRRSRRSTTPARWRSRERFFWTFCDDYVELVKERAYGEGDARPRPRRAALALALSVQLRLLAPFLPFVTEEAWSWWQDGSVHPAPWPTAQECGERRRRRRLLTAVADGAGRRPRRQVAGQGLPAHRRHPRRRHRPAEQVARVRAGEADLRAAGRIGALELADGGDELRGVRGRAGRTAGLTGTGVRRCARGRRRVLVPGRARPGRGR